MKEKFTIKTCLHHGKTEFVLEKDKYYRCKYCRSKAVQKRRDKLKELAVEYMGGKCSKCSYDRCIGALEFHHLDPSQKDFGISAKGHTRSWDKVKHELDKCLMLCANCHRELHAEKLVCKAPDVGFEPTTTILTVLPPHLERFSGALHT